MVKIIGRKNWRRKQEEKSDWSEIFMHFTASFTFVNPDLRMLQLSHSPRYFSGVCCPTIPLQNSDVRSRRFSSGEWAERLCQSIGAGEKSESSTALSAWLKISTIMCCEANKLLNSLIQWCKFFWTPWFFVNSLTGLTMKKEEFKNVLIMLAHGFAPTLRVFLCMISSNTCTSIKFTSDYVPYVYQVNSWILYPWCIYARPYRIIIARLNFFCQRNTISGSPNFLLQKNNSDIIAEFSKGQNPQNMRVRKFWSLCSWKRKKKEEGKGDQRLSRRFRGHA